ncbi:iron-containing redox enzyme family protein [Janibacter limosus]|uniref:iron-containing redox enzyme family protein n=1 Tax=Janibacter limosus TaxID=53458 RepID=UPI000A5087A9|nr:iron-containing redox enzyme family protein [Janibacter limosus]
MSAPLPEPRGPVSERVLRMLRGDGPSSAPLVSTGDDVLQDEDAQLSLWLLLELHHRGLQGVDPELEWDPQVIGLRRDLEQVHLAALRELVRDRLALVDPDDDLARQIGTLLAQDDGPSVADFLARRADTEQFLDFLRQRSIYHLKESDPHAFVVPRLDGPAKVALAELQYDEFGAGRPAGLHSLLFAQALRACGLDPSYGAYLDGARASTLAVNTTMSIFGLHRRWRGAAMGHLAAFESTSSMPCRRISTGARRLGLPDAVAVYYDEHIEADAVHEQLAIRNICVPLVADEPELREDVLLGVAACLALDALAGREQLALWHAGATEEVAV